MAGYKNIVVAIDLSDVSLRTVEKAVALSQAWGARLSLCHVIEPMYYHGYPYVAEFETALIDHAQKEMKALGERFNIPEKNLKIGSGSVKAELIEIAKEMQADLIIVARHGHSGLARLLGSSASAIVHGSTCDVLVIHEE
jgi:universal stress protein A